MIELHISPGYALDAHETKGGLQPTVESLGIPAEIEAKIRRWKNQWIADYEAPKFIGREAYEMRGRDIAGELQKTVGNQFHVIFRHWVKFDPQRWRTLWREDDLSSGEQDKFWIDDDLPEDLVTKVVKIYPDFGGAYLWDLDGSLIGNEDPIFSDTLDARFTAWSELWDAHYDLKSMKLDKEKLAAEGFDEQGIALAAELKRSVGNGVKVIYYCTLRKATLELLEDGSTRELPEGTDFRQWALDHRENPNHKSL